MHNHNIVYLIEGDLSTWVNKYKVQSNTLYTALFSLNYYKGFSVIRTMDINETAEYILRMCDKFHRNHQRQVPHQRFFLRYLANVPKGRLHEALEDSWLKFYCYHPLIGFAPCRFWCADQEEYF